jgi:hypothetical protein
VRVVQLVVQALEAGPYQLVRLVLDRLLLVQHGGVVELRERVDEQLPVRTDLGLVREDLGHLTERVALHALGELAEIVSQGLRGRVQVDEDEPFPYLAPHRLQAVRALVDAEELLFLLDEGQLAI